MWTVRVIIRYFDNCTKRCVELAVEQCISLALQELFGTVCIGAVTVTYPLARGRCIPILPPIICVIMHCPDKHNEVVHDSPEGTKLFVEESISLALQQRFDNVLVDMVTVSYSPHEDRWRADIPVL